MAKVQDLIIDHDFDRQHKALLMSRGVDYSTFLRNRATVDVTESIETIKVVIPNILTRTINQAKQLSALSAILNQPFRSNYVLGISSYPTDAKACAVAAEIMSRAVLLQKKQKAAKIGQGLPLWHKLYGGFGDNLRDAKKAEETPSMLVFSNLIEESTSVKIEKLRDLLVKFDAIPRIVVLGGVDPVTFFATKVHYAVDASILLGPDHKVRTV
jgi:hypothetical protein